MKIILLAMMLYCGVASATCSCVCINGESTQICTGNELPKTLCNELCSGVDLSGNSKEEGDE